MRFIREYFERNLFESVTNVINNVFSGFNVVIIIWLTMAILQRLYFNFTYIILILNIFITFLQLLFVIIAIFMLCMYLIYILEDNQDQFGDWLCHSLWNIYPTDRNCINLSIYQKMRIFYKKYISKYTNTSQPSNQTNPNE